MKINPIHSQPTPQSVPPKPKTNADFASLLAEQSQAQGLAGPPAPPAALSVQTLLAQDTERTVMEQLASLMDQWDAYAQSVDQANLKHGHALLGSIQQTLASVKDAVEKAPAVNPTLKAMVDEMEILGVTEEIKFNRGDYL